MGDISRWALAGFDVDDDDEGCGPSLFREWMNKSELEIREIIRDAHKAGYKGDSKYHKMVDSILQKSSWTESQRKALWMHFKSFLGS